jgi:RHH-type proline utilization regulon transcriptional repressor/proline dehydrogenase/delta 1-pyrroline-5-carboxylate dehydrogenase
MLQDLEDVEAGLVSAAAQRRPGGLARAAAVLDWAQHRLAPTELERLTRRLSDYADWIERYFRREHSAREVLGQENLFRYRVCSPLLGLIGAEASLLELGSVAGAALLSGSALHLSVAATEAGGSAAEPTHALGAACHLPVHVESAVELAARLAGARYERIRWLGGAGREPPELILRAAGAIGCHVSTRPVLGHGRHELLFYHWEQTLSIEYHRYGHLGWRTAGMERPRR